MLDKTGESIFVSRADWQLTYRIAKEKLRFSLTNTKRLLTGTTSDTTDRSLDYSDKLCYNT